MFSSRNSRCFGRTLSGANCITHNYISKSSRMVSRIRRPLAVGIEMNQGPTAWVFAKKVGAMLRMTWCVDVHRFLDAANFLFRKQGLKELQLEQQELRARPTGEFAFWVLEIRSLISIHIQKDRTAAATSKHCYLCWCLSGERYCLPGLRFQVEPPSQRCDCELPIESLCTRGLGLRVWVWWVQTSAKMQQFNSFDSNSNWSEPKIIKHPFDR